MGKKTSITERGTSLSCSHGLPAEKKKDLKLNGMETLSEFCNNRVVPMPAVQTSGYNAWRFGDMGNVSVLKTRIPLHARGKNIGVDNTWLLQQHFPVTQATKQFSILQK